MISARCRQVLHGPLDRELGRLVVVLEDLGVVLGLGVDEHAADDDQVVGLRSAGIVPSATQSATALATAYCAGPNIWTACFIPLIVTLVISTVAGLAIRLGVSTASRLRVAGRLVGQRVGERGPDRAGLVADQQVDVGDLVPFADEGLTDVHDDVAGHGVFSEIGSHRKVPDSAGRHPALEEAGHLLGRPATTTSGQRCIWTRIIDGRIALRQPPAGRGTMLVLALLTRYASHEKRILRKWLFWDARRWFNNHSSGVVLTAACRPGVDGFEVLISFGRPTMRKLLMLAAVGVLFSGLSA